MSGQYPPPNPYSRPHHQRPPPSPWSHSQSHPPGMNVVRNPMNFYGSPHMGLPGRGAQTWASQPHPKPSDVRPTAANPLFGLQMLMTPGENQRIPSQYQQEETMDLSSHSGAVRPDPALRNGTVLPVDVNGEVDTEPKVTSVIATNPLRESMDPFKSPDTSVVRRVDSLPLSTNPQTSTCVKSDVSELVENVSSSVTRDKPSVNESFESNSNSLIKTDKISFVEPVVKPKSTDLSRLSDICASDSLGKTEEQSTHHSTVLNKIVSDFGAAAKSEEHPDVNDSQFSYLDSSNALSVDTDESRLVVAETSAEDIFGMSPVEGLTSLETEKLSDTRHSEPVAEPTPVLSTSEVQWSSRHVSSQDISEPRPSVENVEILLENMFNSQEETSCSSLNSNGGVPQSVIVSSGMRVPLETAQSDMIMPMKEEELAMTLAEDTPVQLEVKEEKEDNKQSEEPTDEIEKQLEMLTESASTELPRQQAKVELVKEELDSNMITKEVISDDSAVVPKEENKPVETEAHSQEVKNQVNSSSNPFIEVETQLEQMFAGIVEPMDDATSDNQAQPSVSEPKRPVVSKKPATKRKKANSRRPSDNSVFGGSSGESTPVLKKRGRKRLNDSGSEKGSKKMKMDNVDSIKKGKLIKDITNDSLSSKAKGPFIHVEGSKDNPTSVVVVNKSGVVRADDDDGTDKSGARRKHSLQRTEGSSRRGGPAYSASTLSVRYNASTPDATWVCVFCKRGPHSTGPEPAGDLFGPYRVPALPPKDEAAPPGTPADRDIVEEQKRRGGKFPKSIRASGGTELFVQKAAKKGKKVEGVEGQPGLLVVDGELEVWLHAGCAEWAPGLSLLGCQLIGLDDAVWTALRTKCTHCGVAGAGVGCVVRNCPTRVHYPCALLSGWLLDSETYIARCYTHRTRLRNS